MGNHSGYRHASREDEHIVQPVTHDRLAVLGEQLGTFLGTLWLWAARRHADRENFRRGDSCLPSLRFRAGREPWLD